MRKSIKKLIAVASASVMALTLAVTAVPNSASATNVSKAGKKAAKAAFNPDGEYHAYFGMQQKESWIFRDEWYAEENGLGGTSWEKTPGLAFDSGTIFQSGDSGNVAIEGTKVTDAVIKGNGVYTVGVEGLNGVLADAESANQAVMSMIYVNTDIPWSAKDNPVTISDVKLTLDGMDQVLPAEVFYPMEYIDQCGLLRFDPFNLYQKENGPYPDNPSILTPRDSIQITFKISGFTNDNPEAVEATPTPAPEKKSDSGSSSSSKTESGGISTGAVIAIVVVVVIVIAAIIVVATKKKRD